MVVQAIKYNEVVGTNQSDNISAVIDSILRIATSGGLLATALFAPDAIKLLDKPSQKYFAKLDKRQRARELKRLQYYMKQQGLVAYTTDDYEHGITVTKRGLKRLRQREFITLCIEPQKDWDHKWRLVFFDIPETKRQARRALMFKLKEIGFVQLQRSVWCHPFPCRPEIEIITSKYEVHKYVSYVEATHIDNQKLLIKRFPSLKNLK